MSATNRPDWLDDRKPLAPWNRIATEPEPDVCADCGTTQNVHHYTGSDEMVCDACLVANVVACGDWDSESIAALDWLNNNNDGLDTH
jgi:hypothetical protein